MIDAEGAKANLAKPILPLLVVLIALWYNWWVLSPNHFFFADDWHWLWVAAFRSWDFSIFPRAVYNDRPVGALVITVLYRLFGLNYAGYGISLLAIHIANCLLLYAFARRYLSHLGCFVAAALAATWSSSLAAMTWLAAMFDLFGTTLILLMLLSQQYADRTGKLWPTAVSLVAYMLAMRTKEFAIGGALLIFFMESLCEKKDIRSAIKKTAPFLIVSAIYGFIYLYFVVDAKMAQFNLEQGSHSYTLDVNPTSLIANLWFYLSQLLYAAIIGPANVALMLALLVAGTILSPPALRSLIYFSFAAFLLMLGPTLGLTLHRDTLYLYAPHFFAALAIGALCNDWTKPAFVIGSLLAIVVAATPLVTASRTYQINFALRHGDTARNRLMSILEVLGPSPPKDTLIVIGGVEPFFNPFASGPGSSLKIAYGDESLQTAVDKPDPELLKLFCQAGDRPRRYIAFEGVQAKDISSKMAESCPS